MFAPIPTHTQCTTLFYLLPSCLPCLTMPYLPSLCLFLHALLPCIAVLPDLYCTTSQPCPLYTPACLPAYLFPIPALPSPSMPFYSAFYPSLPHTLLAILTLDFARCSCTTALCSCFPASPPCPYYTFSCNLPSCLPLFPSYLQCYLACHPSDVHSRYFFLCV